MSFHEVSLPARLAFGSTGGVERRTEVVALASGFERRSTPWAEGRRRWLIGANLRSLADMAELVAFFEARAGRLHGFRFRDFMDFRSCAPGGEPAATDQAIGTGDGETSAFQLTKRGRVIRKPVAGSVVVAVDGFVVEAEVDTTNGMVTLETAPGEGAAVTAGFLFDVPVRFDADRIDVTLESFDAGRMAAVPLVEIRI
ncbi:DUF2460 domain-containing protein [Brevundimonas fluminis]|uniref:DUF2460 domain-containing protein n=1 Tax=Brevundimonas fluminis TaxID=2487274 RepID=UPI000F658AA9|nr:DUF2460 domain-containing protein [Brevundimonas fluminis]